MSRLNGSKVPVNLDAERNLLGSWMLSEEALEDSYSMVEEQDFSTPKHKAVYRACAQSIKKYGRCDDTIALEFLDRGLRTDLLEMLSGVPSPRNSTSYARIVKEKSLQRMLIEGSQELGAAAQAGEDYEAAVESLQRLIVRTKTAGVSAPKTMTEILASAPEHLDALTDPPLFVRKGMTTLASETKVGKTNWWLHVAWALTTGESLWGWLTPTSPISVLLVELDLTEATIHRRLTFLREALGWSQAGQDRFNVKCTRSLQLDTPRGLTRLRQMVQTTVPRPELVIIDNYNAAVSGDPDKTVESRRAFQSLRDVQEQTGVSFGLTYELRKPPPGVKPKYNIGDLKGNNVVAYEADAVVMLRPKDETRRELEMRFPALRHCDDLGDDLILTRNGLSFKFGREKDQKEATILGILREHKERGGAMTHRDCGAALKAARCRYDKNELSSYIRDVDGAMV